MVDLSIIIVNYRSKGLVKTCLKGIYQAHIQRSFEIIVVDNASHDGCVEMVHEFYPGVKTIAAKENLGLAFGNNLGIRASRGAYLLIINPDIAVFEGMVEKMIEYLEKNSHVALLGPKLINPDQTVQSSIYRFPTPVVPLYRRTPLGRLPWAKTILSEYVLAGRDRNVPRPVDWVLGACMLIQRQAYEVIGDMDERFFLYFEDVDWCRRFWSAGYEVHYFPGASLVHYHRRLSAEYPGLSGVLTRATRIHITSGIKYYLKYFRVPHPKTRTLDVTE